MAGRRHKALTYEDALRLLGVDDSKIIRLADRLAGAAGVAAGAATFGALDLLGFRDELVEWSRSVIRTVAGRSAKLGRYDRTQLIEAAHGVIVVLSYLEALAEEEGIDLDAVDVSAGDVSGLAAGDELVTQMAQTPLPSPSPSRPHEDLLRELRSYYAWSGVQLARFDLWPDDRTLGRVVDRAVERYELHLRALAVDVPEFGLWLTAIDSQATQSLVKDLQVQVTTTAGSLTSGLQGIAALLDPLAAQQAIADRRRAELAESYRRRLDRQVLEVSGVADDLPLPSLGALYINPPCKVRGKEGRAPIGEADPQIETDAQRFLAAYLTSPEATRAPLAVIGQPGSGKSSLSTILAARLPEAEFLTLVVRLREVPADARVQDQVDAGVHAALGERMTWADLARSAATALPVVILDGLDEMLQASDRDRPAYLEEVLAFQRDEADRGRPLAVLVTSRPGAAHSVRIPGDVTLLSLEPFGRSHVREWVEGWNRLCADLRVSLDREPLSFDLITRFSDLVEQPLLLLLLLALYDLRTGRLAVLPPGSTHADLYEAVLSDYARPRSVDVSPLSPPTTSPESWRCCSGSWASPRWP